MASVRCKPVLQSLPGFDADGTHGAVSGKRQEAHRRRAAGSGSLLICAVCLALTSPDAIADDHPRVLDRVSVSVGGYETHSSTTLGASIPAGLGVDVNLEDDLGFDTNSFSNRFRANFLIGDRQGLGFDYYSYRHDSSLHRDFAVSLPDGERLLKPDLRGKLSFTFGSAAWRWWFGDEDTVVGLGIGAGHYRVAVDLNGHVEAAGHTYRVDESAGVSTWAPMVQAGWRHAFNDHWRMYFSAAGVFKNGGSLRGHIYNASFGVEWLPTDHWGLSLEYGLNNVRVRQDTEDYRRTLNLDLSGPSAFVHMRF